MTRSGEGVPQQLGRPNSGSAKERWQVPYLRRLQGYRQPCTGCGPVPTPKASRHSCINFRRTEVLKNWTCHRRISSFCYMYRCTVQGLYRHPHPQIAVPAHQTTIRYRIRPNHFQKTMATILSGIPHVICYIDDILVTGIDDTEH